jgi:hypothetical protein
VHSVTVSQLVSLSLLTLCQFVVPPAHLNPVTAWAEVVSGARSFRCALNSTLTSFAAAAAVLQLFQATVSASQIRSIAVPHASIQLGEVPLHVLLAEAAVSVASVLFFNKLLKSVAVFKAMPSFVLSNLFQLMLLQTPAMALLGNVNPASAVGSMCIHQQPQITIAQLFGNVLAVVFYAVFSDAISKRAQVKEKKD